jgi:hypothetical protein
MTTPDPDPTPADDPATEPSHPDTIPDDGEPTEEHDVLEL